MVTVHGLAIKIIGFLQLINTEKKDESGILLIYTYKNFLLMMATGIYQWCPPKMQTISSQPPKQR